MDLIETIKSALKGRHHNTDFRFFFLTVLNTLRYLRLSVYETTKNNWQFGQNVTQLWLSSLKIEFEIPLKIMSPLFSSLSKYFIISRARLVFYVPR